MSDGSVSRRIRELRAIRNMSQEELAEKVGYKGRSSISRIESDDRTLPIEMVPKIADALEVSVEYLMFGNIEDGMTVEDMDIIKSYHRAPPHLQKLVREILNVQN